MLDSGVIESSSTEWPSPFVLVDQKMALFGCVDDRQLNTETLANAYPMPKIDDLINRLGKAKYTTTLDITRGYCTDAKSSQASHSLHHTLWSLPV